jgi:hypothetical protein
VAAAVGELAVNVDAKAPLVEEGGEGIVVGEVFQLADEMLALGNVVHLHHQGPLAAASIVVPLGHRY